MRFDLVTIFPEFFSVLNLSLMGQAVNNGTVSIGVHNLRDWAPGVHRSVDDSPYGGGAGMVMTPTVWGEALDTIVTDHTVLAIPTPSGQPFTQAMARELSRRDHIVIACGRYEGIDQRVAEHYCGRGIRVVEYSIGDYVLNGGETAALVLIEAVARLREGFMSNPQSLVEESFEDSLLEYPAYTRPIEWRGLDVPEVLRSGNHAAVERWRRDRSLERTASRRPDLIAALDPTTLDRHDREILARNGWAHAGGAWRAISVGEVSGALNDHQCEQLRSLAAATFVDACPPSLPTDAIDAHVEHMFAPVQWRHWASEDDIVLVVATVDQVVTGYALARFHTRAKPAEGFPEGVLSRWAGDEYIVVDKCYVDRAWRGSGVAGALLGTVIEKIRNTHPGTNTAILGTHHDNRRAREFYRAHGFRKRGRRTYVVGGIVNDDVVMVCDLTP